MPRPSPGAFLVLALTTAGLAQRARAQDLPPAPTGPADPRDREIADLRKRLETLEGRFEPAPEGEPARLSNVFAPTATADPDFAPRYPPYDAITGDTSWAPGGYAPAKSPLKWGPFTGEVRIDTAYHWEVANPKDDTVAGSSEVFRHNEVQATQIGFGGDFYYKGAQARLMTQFGMYSSTTPRNDASPARGQWNLSDAYKYISEGYGGYHFDVQHGLNIQAGIFMSYVGLWSYYNFDNWTYQPSYVSSNTPWYFDGVRIQWFPTSTLKVEPWYVNGWQSYGKLNHAPGVGLQVRWWPAEWLSVLGNQYFGYDTFGGGDPDVRSNRRRLHTDDSIMVRYYDKPDAELLSRAAASLTLDAGSESGQGARWDQQYFLGFMAYQRLWFWRNMLGLTFGGGAITNPGRYLVLIPPVNGATAFTGTPFFTANPGQSFTAWDLQVTADYMPVEYVTFRIEYTHRFANVPYFAGSGGVTPPGGNTGAAGSDPGTGWRPDLIQSEDRVSFAFMVRF